MAVSSILREARGFSKHAKWTLEMKKMADKLNYCKVFRMLKIACFK